MFSARQHAERAICYRKSVCPSVCPSHGSRVDQSKTVEVMDHAVFTIHTVAPSLSCLWYKFHPEIPTGSPRAGASNEGGLGKRALSVF